MDIKRECELFKKILYMRIYVIQNREFLRELFLLINWSSSAFSNFIVYLLTYKNEGSKSGSLFTD